MRICSNISSRDISIDLGQGEIFVVENVSRRVEIYRSYRESFRLDFVTGVTKERRKMGRFLHTAVSFQFHENSTGILLFDAKLAANTAAVYKRLHSCAMKTR